MSTRPRTRKPRLPRGYSEAAYDWLALQYPTTTSRTLIDAVLMAFDAGHESGHTQGARDAEAAAVMIDPKTGRPRDLIAQVRAGLPRTEPANLVHRGEWRPLSR